MKKLLIVLFALLLVGCVGQSFNPVDQGEASIIAWEGTDDSSGIGFVVHEIRTWGDKSCIFVRAWSDDGYKATHFECIP